MDRRHFMTSGAAFMGMAGISSARAGDGLDRSWEIGPVIRGRNYSVGMPLHPAALNAGWYFDFPAPSRSEGHVHYVTRRTGPLVGARGLRLHYRIDAPQRTRFVPQEHPDRQGLLSLFIQRKRDNWLARGRTRFHRWYSPNSRVMPLERGEHELTILFDENWISVMGSDRQRSPREFEEALADAARIGFTFGSNGGRGHGVYATAPARFTLLAFTVL